MTIWRVLILGCLAANLLATGSSARGQICGCFAVPTLRERIELNPVAVIAHTPFECAPEPVPGAQPAIATFHIDTVLKGGKLLGETKSFDELAPGDARPGQSYFLIAIEAPKKKLVWMSPVPLSPRGVDYVIQLAKLPASERAKLYLDHLDDRDEELASDAVQSLSAFSYRDQLALKPHLKRDRLVARIKANESGTQLRLDLTLLGIAGTKEEVPLLEAMIKSDRPRAAFDATIACYLSLRGSEGVPLIEELFLKNKQATYIDTFCALMALRFHATEANIIPRERIKQAFRLTLDRPSQADLVVGDLARMEDWTVMPRVVKLFRDAEGESLWVRIPAIHYLRACPLPEAKAHLAELEKLDPEIFKQIDAPDLIAPAEAEPEEPAE